VGQVVRVLLVLGALIALIIKIDVVYVVLAGAVIPVIIFKIETQKP
jgi:hypothetical protein